MTDVIAVCLIAGAFLLAYAIGSIGKARGIDTAALSEEKEAMYQALVSANKAAE